MQQLRSHEEVDCDPVLLTESLSGVPVNEETEKSYYFRMKALDQIHDLGKSNVEAPIDVRDMQLILNKSKLYICKTIIETKTMVFRPSIPYSVSSSILYWLL